MWNIDYYTGTSQQLFTTVPSSGDSYWKDNTMFDLEYCNWNKDLFMGVLPDSQFGDVASIDTGGLKAQDLSVQAKISSSSKSSVYLGAKTASTGSDFAVNAGPNAVQSNPLVVALPAVAASFDVLALRRGEALQRWKEISLNVPQNYRAQIKAHFGVDVGENMSGMSTYIGGDSSSLDISEVVNTNLQSGSTSSEAVIAGKDIRPLASPFLKYFCALS